MAYFLTGILMIAFVASAQASLPDSGTLRNWIQEMKQSPRGPFKQIRWFCADGTVQPPQPYACRERGGGNQHGEWNDRIKLLRAGGYYIANVLAALKPEDFLRLPEKDELLKQILLEQFLIAADDGWIFRRAYYYPGALQAEEEIESGFRLLLGLLKEPDWGNMRFTLLREAVRLLPHERGGAFVTRMRQLTRAISEKDKGFEKLRIKIHVKPDARDGERVRSYAAQHGLPELSADYEALAQAIDQVFGKRNLGPELSSLARRLKDPALAQNLRKQTARLSAERPPAMRLAAAGELLALLRERIFRVRNGDARLTLALVDASLELEQEVFRAGSELTGQLDGATRLQRISWLESGVEALYGAGLISPWQRQALEMSFRRLWGSALQKETYKGELDYLSRVPEWADRWLRFHFSRNMEHLALLEPLARNFIQDRLRGSPLLFYAAVLDSLAGDADRLVGIRHELFGETVAGGLRGLNPGLARGTLRILRPDEKGKKMDPAGIYVLPATTAELPPVAGIVTAGEGNSLSHVQLLARNLGIPNVVVAERLLPRLVAREGRRVILAVSPQGTIKVDEGSAGWDQVFGREETSRKILIRPDLAKLDLQRRAFIPLQQLKAKDSGRLAGPKAANLGELKSLFPDAVADGLVIPFGVFRGLLDKPMGPGEPSAFRWMENQYAQLRGMKNDAAKRDQMTRLFLKRLRAWITNADPGDEFRERLRSSMAAMFGPDGSYGVFVRSDTNVEDLPGFTGAGLNLTVPHVVGFEKVWDAIRRVWASPFTERAYAWRQSHMANPEHVYVSVLLMKSVPAEKSGVMVTTDLERGRPGWITVAANEGVGGAVNGQEAEELRIHVPSGEIRLIAQATEPLKRVLLPEGGVGKIAVKDTETILGGAEIRRLIELARTLPSRYPMLRDKEGRTAPADVEFGFLGGRLFLFQIRPFLESVRARRSRFLNSLDGELERKGVGIVDLDQIPPGERK